MMKSCIYPGSFDPITLGHLDIIKRAASMFEVVYVAVGNNSSKSGTFTVNERMGLIGVASQNIPNVKVVSFSGLLADFCYELGCKVVIKGVRNFQDFDYERLLNDVGQTQQSGIETITLFAKTELSHVSSTASKELLKYNGLVDGYVPLNVKEAMEIKMLEQRILGVTGEIGMGKSFFTKKLIRHAYVHFEHSPVIEIDLDKIGHDILHDRTEPVYVELRKNIIQEFSLKGDVIDRSSLGSIVFNDSVALGKLNSMMRIPMLTRIRKEVGNKKGLIVLNGALLAEAGFLTLCNNNIIVINSPQEKQVEVLKKRGLSDEQVVRRIMSQMTTFNKIETIKKSISDRGFGKLVLVENMYDEKNVSSIINSICLESFSVKLS